MIGFASLFQYQKLEQTLQHRTSTALFFFLTLQKPVQQFSPGSNLLLGDFNILHDLPLCHSVLLYSARATHEISMSPPFAYMTINRVAQTPGKIKYPWYFIQLRCIALETHFKAPVKSFCRRLYQPGQMFVLSVTAAGCPEGDNQCPALPQHPQKNPEWPK